MIYFKTFENFQMPDVFYHYTSQSTHLLPGDVIHSNQTKAQTYQLVWNIYAKVYFEMFNKEFPKEYGYAYPEKKDKPSMKEYIVKPEADVIFGNYNHSVYYVMDGLRHFVDRSLPLKERIALRDQKIAEQAVKYFTLTEYSQYVEAICSKFIVVR